MLHTYIECLLLKAEDLPWSRRHYLMLLASYLMASVGVAFYMHAVELAPSSASELAVKAHAALMEMKHIDSSTIYWQRKLCLAAYALCSLPYFIMVALWLFYLAKKFVFWRFLSGDFMKILFALFLVVIGLILFRIVLELPVWVLLVKVLVWN